LLAHALLLQSLLDFDSLSAGLWYVAIDFQLFALLAILLWLGRYSGGAPILVLALATAALFWFNRDASWDNWALYFFGSYGLGAAAWWASDRKRPAAWLVIIACVTIAALALDFRLRIALALAVALLLGFNRRSGLLEKWPQSTVLAFLGRISYSVFLVHFPIYLVANALFMHFGLTTPGAALLSIFAAWTASIAVATLFHRWIEGPAASRRIAGAFGQISGKA
jgi:peptidoglycan/LPS O-acetylase OafA/YrhL